MTLEEEESLSKHASALIHEYVRPILGDINTPTIHKLLRHLLDAIRMHGLLRNKSTSSETAQNKTYERFYRRTTGSSRLSLSRPPGSLKAPRQCWHASIRTTMRPFLLTDSAASAARSRVVAS